MGLGKPKLCTKFEVTSFSHRVNIEGGPPKFKNSPSLGLRPLLFCVCFYDGTWQTPAARHAHFSSGCDFMMGLGKPKLCTKFAGCPLIFLQRLKLATSNLVHSLGLPRVIIKSHRRKSGGGLGLGELLKNLGFPYISATAITSNFKISMLLGFAKAHHKISHRRKSGRGPVL